MNLGKVSLIINLSFEACFECILLLKCKGISPANNGTFNTTRCISASSALDERCALLKFAMLHFQVKMLLASKILYTDACDSRHRIEFYYLKGINSNKVAVGLNSIIRGYESIVLKPLTRISLIRLLVYECVLSS